MRSISFLCYQLTLFNENISLLCHLFACIQIQSMRIGFEIQSALARRLFAQANRYEDTWQSRLQKMGVG